MPPPDGNPRIGPSEFYRVITEAVNDFAEHGYASQAQLDRWLEAIRRAALASMVPDYVVENELRGLLQSVFDREIKRGAILRHHKGLEAFKLANVKPALHAELDRRIRAATDLIKLNRPAAVDKTLQRFAGWATSVPAGGSRVIEKVDTKKDIRKALAQLPFEVRRLNIDQSHKLVASLNQIIADDAGAIAGKWYSHFQQAGYDYRKDHKKRHDKIYLIRNSWAHRAGLVKPGKPGYLDEITAPGEEPFCRCFVTYLYHLRALPENMLMAKGKAELARVRAA